MSATITATPYYSGEIGRSRPCVRRRGARIETWGGPQPAAARRSATGVGVASFARSFITWPVRPAPRTAVRMPSRE